MSQAPSRSVFPRPKSGTASTSKPAKSRKPGMKAPTRANITPVDDQDLRPIASHANRFTEIPANRRTAPWPGNLDMEPNAMSRSAVFGCSRRKGTGAMMLTERILPSQSQYVVKYAGPDLDQSDSEVWQVALSWCRASGKPMGTTVWFAFNDWCRILNRSENDGHVNDGIMQSLERLGHAIVKWDSLAEKGFASLLINAGQDKKFGRGYLTLNADLVERLMWDCTELHLRRKVRLKSNLAKWMHDYFSTSSTPHPHNLTTLLDLSGTPSNTPMSNFRVRVLKAVDELKECDPPLFAPETRVAKKANGEYALFVVKATNSRILPPKRAQEPVQPVVVAPAAPALPAPVPAPAEPVVTTRKPSARRKIEKPAAPVEEEFIAPWNKNLDPSDDRDEPQRKRDWIKARDRAEYESFADAR
ncbi:plasmid replication initiator TrfA [Burkholderia vietnamiensis]|uniref:plasmid replication initiator TrfA n=1 Tax=Burkholderia vietnamiensis TaxID=60552 RepID=UPI001CF17DE4|nr:plasmid replication initiator TrfA [Burkholderia vietnamiensis]MCA8448949.1 hypothetical protein [Burkholderia vietnamiensis]